MTAPRRRWTFGLRTLFVVVGGMLATSTGCDPATRRVPDSEILVGRWVYDHLEGAAAGIPAVEREFKCFEFEIDGRNLRFLDRLNEPYSYSINTTTNPKRMRISSQANPSDGFDILYKADATQLTLGINPHGAEMTGFDDGITLVLKRAR